jgi:hypothetical protein
MIIIDRFEGETAVCEDGDNRLEIPCSALPEGAKEGDIIQQKSGIWQVDGEKTAKRREEMLGKLKRLGY